MSATVADLNPKTLENAKRQFVELYGSALVMNTYLKIALVLVSLVAAWPPGAQLPHRLRYPGQAAGHPDRRGRAGRGRAVRRDRVPAAAARAALLPDAVHREAFQPAPSDRAARVSGLAAVPGAALADATIAQNDQSRVIETFLTNPSADEVDIVVQNVSLSELGEASVQGLGELPEAALHAGHPTGAWPSDVRRARGRRRPWCRLSRLCRRGRRCRRRPWCLPSRWCRRGRWCRPRPWCRRPRWCRRGPWSRRCRWCPRCRLASRRFPRCRTRRYRRFRWCRRCRLASRRGRSASRPFPCWCRRFPSSTRHGPRAEGRRSRRHPGTRPQKYSSGPWQAASSSAARPDILAATSPGG